MIWSFVLCFCAIAYSNAQTCGSWGGCQQQGAPCCSKWGYCGIGDNYCGAGCQSGCSGGSRPPPPSPPTPPPSSGSGSVSSLISKASFNSALSQCGINRPDIYDALVGGFTAPLKGGLTELALLIGNLAHESGGFQYTEEIACAGVTQVTAQCPYGLYHGRGYIQISWQYNYQAAANYLNNQAIVNNPNIVRDNPTVNWQTVQWYWTSAVQPVFQRAGYTLGASVRAINGALECGNVNAQRVKYIQCFQQNFGVPVSGSTQCPSAVGDAETVFTTDSSVNPSFTVALIVLGTITLTLALIAVVLVLLVIMRKSAQRV